MRLVSNGAIYVSPILSVSLKAVILFEFNLVLSETRLSAGMLVGDDNPERENPPLFLDSPDRWACKAPLNKTDSSTICMNCFIERKDKTKNDITDC